MKSVHDSAHRKNSGKSKLKYSYNRTARMQNQVILIRGWQCHSQDARLAVDVLESKSD
jgi:hypothetical protein